MTEQRTMNPPERVEIAPLAESPRRLWSLWEMIEFRAERFAYISEVYRTISTIFRHNAQAAGSASHRLDEDDIRQASKYLDEVIELLGSFGAYGSADAAALAKQSICNACSYQSADHAIQTAVLMFGREMHRWHMLLLGPEDTHLFHELEGYWGARALERFPSAAEDMLEANKCLALARHTGSVFHLMRVLELTCSAIWKSLGSPTTRSKMNGWGDYRVEIGKYLENKDKDERPPDWADKKPFYEDLDADLSTVYRAWRCPTMHIEKSYTKDKADGIFNAARSLVRDASIHLDEDGNYYP